MDRQIRKQMPAYQPWKDRKKVISLQDHHNRHSRRHSSVTARTLRLRERHETTVFDQRIHLSESMEKSREWFAQQIAIQRASGGLFKDKYLSADDATIGQRLSSRRSTLEWMRPIETVGSLQPWPVYQCIANCFFKFAYPTNLDFWSSEITNVLLVDHFSSMFDICHINTFIMPPGQSFDKHASGSNGCFAYCGMFWFRFWRFGDWYDVVVDDRLPTRNGSLVFMHSKDRREFWSALMEKAYVKLVGTYDALAGGCTSDAMEDFTGGLTEVVDLGDATPHHLFEIMSKVHSRATLMACSIDAQPHEIESAGPMGLIRGHAYSVTDVRTVETNHGRVNLVRVRNPWGNESEWTGPWSDLSREWKNLRSSERRRIDLKIEQDGEFWMCFDDFKTHFSRLEYCHLGPESMESGRCTVDNTVKRRWEMTKEEGEWVKFSSAGGCRNNKDTFHMNPQFRVQVIDPDETDDDNKGTIIVGLMQKDRRSSEQKVHVIGYSIYRLEERHLSEGLLGKAFFRANQSVANSTFVNMREVVGRHKLRPGMYVIIPSTFGSNEEAKFMLRVFSERPCASNEIDDTLTIGGDDLTTPSSRTEDDEFTRKLKAAFNVVAGPEGILSYSELRDILNTVFNKDFDFPGFSCEAARSMVALMDSIFKKFDHDHNGTFDAFELRDVLRQIGFHVTNRVYRAVISRYANKSGEILFDDYILLLVRLVTVIETFKAQERLPDGRAAFGIEDFTRSVIYI